MRFKMRFEGDEAPERSGTIIEVGDSVSWSSLKVQWDEPSPIIRPGKVSPCEVEPLVAATPPSSQPVQRNKRARPSISPPGASDHSSDFGMWKPPSETFSFSGIRRSRESIGFNGNTTPSPISSNPGSVKFNGSTESFSARADSQIESFSASINKEPTRKKQESSNGNGCRLFGIQIECSNTTEESSPVAAAFVVSEDRPQPSQVVYSKLQSQPSNANQSDDRDVSGEPKKSCLRSPQENQCRQLRSCTKVHMHVMAVGRAVDLTSFDGYEDLLRKLEEMFSIEGELTCAAKKWQVVYTDDENDMMLVGDDPWHEFCSMVGKIFIYTCDEAKRLSPKVKLTVLNGEGISKNDAATNADAPTKRP